MTPARPRARNIASVVVDGEAVVYDDERGMVHVLNATARGVWERCDGSATVDDIVSDLSVQYDADRAAIHADVVAAIAELGRLGLLEHTSSP